MLLKNRTKKFLTRFDIISLIKSIRYMKHYFRTVNILEEDIHGIMITPLDANIYTSINNIEDFIRTLSAESMRSNILLDKFYNINLIKYFIDANNNIPLDSVDIISKHMDFIIVLLEMYSNKELYPAFSEDFSSTIIYRYITNIVQVYREIYMRLNKLPIGDEM